MVVAFALFLLWAPSGAAATPGSPGAWANGSDLPGPDEHPAEARVEFTSWKTWAEWRSGDGDGVASLPGQRTGIVMTSAAGTTEVDDPHGEARTWEYARWTSPATDLSFDATELVASWNAATPGESWIAVEMKGTYTDGSTTPWYVLGHWASDDATVARTSVEGQDDEHSVVLTDTVMFRPGAQASDEPRGETTAQEPSAATTSSASDHPAADHLRLSSYQLRVTLYRPPGSLFMPRIWLLGAMASDVPDRSDVEPSTGGSAWGQELNVPRRSKYTHLDNYPEYGGGAGWSSPTATTMVMEYFGVMPPRADMDWIEAGYTDPQVAHAARSTWDHAFEGAGNWSFNTAYAASFRQLDAYTTRMRSLEDIESFIDAGIPVITSQSFTEHELDGAGYSTSGHLVVVTGFTEDGDVVVNDPAAASNSTVRRVYEREQFEHVWLRTQRPLPNGGVGSGPGGIVYVIKPHEHELPEADGPDNPW
jgi:hypothetical protein